MYVRFSQTKTRWSIIISEDYTTIVFERYDEKAHESCPYILLYFSTLIGRFLVSQLRTFTRVYLVEIICAFDENNYDGRGGLEVKC